LSTLGVFSPAFPDDKSIKLGGASSGVAAAIAEGGVEKEELS
jgi:hypothetical protein